MSTYTLKLAEAAVGDLEGIANYIAVELQEPGAALGQIGRIKEAVLTLQEMPERHSLVADKQLAEKGIRKFLVDNYLVFYTVDNAKQVVNIVRILYGRRKWENIL